MPRRILLGPFRCLVQVGLALLGLVTAMVAVAAAAIVVPYPLAAAAIAAQASLGRRLAGAWAGVEIPTPARSPVPEPPRRADGWYVHDNQLYKRRRFPAFMLRLEWLSADPSRLREFTWTFVTPITGMVAVAVPVLLVGGGTGVALLRPWPPVVTAAGAAAAIIAGFALGPAALRAHALFSRSLLQPREESWWHRSALGGWIHRSSQATWHGAGLAGLSVAAFGVGVLTLIATVVSWGGLVPPAATITRPFLDFYRRKAAEWTGREIPDPYRPLPAPPEIDQYGTYQAGRSLHRTRESAVRAQRYNWMLKDPATWRDLLWMLVTPIVAVVGFIPAVLVGFGFFGLVWQPAWWAPWAVPIGLTTGEWVTPWYVWYGITLLWPAAAVVPPWASVGVGLALSLAGCLLALALLRLRSGFDRWLLGPTRATQLAQRVSRLTETRADAIDAQAAELRRIERDLHDGAQARLVAVGLSLATIEALLTHDPEAARALLGQARESSATALAELRDLVRGIHPPVLAERGLVDAVRAVALDSPLPVTVTADLPGRPAAPVESAAYFATSEALANASRHGKAIEVDIGHRDGRLTITVTDDGRGGADPSRGTGLRGMQRRLATFDGTLTIDSPTGGPTVLTMEIPCALSSPRTSTSFGTA